MVCCGQAVGLGSGLQTDDPSALGGQTRFDDSECPVARSVNAIGD